MIERQTGFINLSTDSQLRPGSIFDDVAGLRLGEAQKTVDMQTGWKWLTVKNVTVEGSYFILSLGFYENKLKKIDLIRSKEKFDLMASWQTWSEENERNLLVELRAWIHTELGREGAFGWGKVSAIYDPKGGSSLIHITYT